MTFDLAWIERAQTVIESIRTRFHDPKNDGFFDQQARDDLIVQAKEFTDSALPSGNAMAVLALLRLGEWTSNVETKALAIKSIEAAAGLLERSPSAFATMLEAIQFARGPTYELVLVADAAGNGLEPFLTAFHGKFIPNRVISMVPANDLQRAKTLIPMLASKIAMDRKPTAYVCENYTCQLPVTEPGKMLDQLK